MRDFRGKTAFITGAASGIGLGMARAFGREGMNVVIADIDRAREQARARLERSLAWAREQGVVARGEVGDPSPTTAIEDELRHFGADEVIVVTHPSERETWQERGELERLRRELDVPVIHVVVADHGASVKL